MPKAHRRRRVCIRQTRPLGAPQVSANHRAPVTTDRGPANSKLATQTLASRHRAPGGGPKCLYRFMVPLPEAAATHQILMKTSELLNPYYVTGFTEADGCFYVSIYREPKAKIGFRIVPVFYITQDLASEQVLYAIHHTIAPSEPGKFTKRFQDNTLTYSLRGVQACKSVIAHFDKYPLLGEKQNNFMIFRSILGLLEQKKHLTDPAEVAKLAYTMNTKGASRRRSFPELLRHQSFALS
mgnify:CR=1 FL=1